MLHVKRKISSRVVWLCLTVNAKDATDSKSVLDDNIFLQKGKIGIKDTYFYTEFKNVHLTLAKSAPKKEPILVINYFAITNFPVSEKYAF
jgi:hypothetical protein